MVWLLHKSMRGGMHSQARQGEGERLAQQLWPLHGPAPAARGGLQLKSGTEAPALLTQAQGGTHLA